MTLNRNQRIVVLVATVLIGAIGVYPPWVCAVGEKGSDGKFQTVRNFRSHGWIFSPPYRISSDDDITFRWDMDTQRLIFQWATVVLVFSGLALILKTDNQKAKRSMGLPADVDLPPDVQKQVGTILAKGADAQRAAEARVLATPGAAAPPDAPSIIPVTRDRRGRLTVQPVDRAKLIEDAVQRRLAAIRAKAAGEVKTPSP